MHTKNDKIYAVKQRQITDFNFGRKTAVVFDDMLVRSVPFYLEIQRMIGELTLDFATPGSCVYDIGCSTGTTLIQLDRLLPPKITLVGLDYSPEMLKQARKKLKEFNVRHRVKLIQNDVNKGVDISNASVVIMNLILQFVRPLYREKLIRQIAKDLNPDGALILIEKVLSRDSLLNRFFIKYYYDFKKRNGYSKLEIAQKREALENILIPYKTQENEELLLNNGFSDCEIFFKWYNFCGYIARKTNK